MSLFRRRTLVFKIKGRLSEEQAIKLEESLSRRFKRKVIIIPHYLELINMPKIKKSEPHIYIDYDDRCHTMWAGRKTYLDINNES